MPQKKIQTFHCEPACPLSNAQGLAVVVFDPEGGSPPTKSHYFFVETSAAELSLRLGDAETARTCLFNLSDEQLEIPEPVWLIEFDAAHVYPGMDRVDWSCIDNPMEARAGSILPGSENPGSWPFIIFLIGRQSCINSSSNSLFPCECPPSSATAA